jgi:two-component system, cell cycle response regulator
MNPTGSDAVPGIQTKASALLASSEAISIPRQDLSDLCDRAVQEWQEWGKNLQVDTQVIPAFNELTEMVRMAGSEAEKEEVRATAAPDRLTVVVVDDDPIELKLLVRHLTALGHDVHTAVNGRQALECVLNLSPQLIITDWRMPEMDGMALCRALRQTKVGRQLYILMLTGSEEDDSQIEAFDAGADDYIVKPFRPKILAARVRACARVYRLQQEIEREQDELQRCMSELGVANSKLQHAALTDPLTGIYNRRYAMERLDQEWAAATRSGNPLSCLVIDIDFFKRVNDSYGHDVGDLVLKETAATIRAGLRLSDVICRIGGEEFVVFGPAMDRETARVCAERLRAQVQSTKIEAPCATIRVTLSIGVAERSASMDGPADLLKAADQAVYVAKQEGRNCVCLTASPQQRESVLVAS